MVPGLEERLIEGSDEEAVMIAEMVRPSACAYAHVLTGLQGSKGRFERKIG
jgi:hypothetical protein